MRSKSATATPMGVIELCLTILRHVCHADIDDNHDSLRVLVNTMSIMIIRVNVGQKGS